MERADPPCGKSAHEHIGFIESIKHLARPEVRAFADAGQCRVEAQEAHAFFGRRRQGEALENRPVECAPVHRRQLAIVDTGKMLWGERHA
jgi:hypothetical protein